VTKAGPASEEDRERRTAASFPTNRYERPIPCERHQRLAKEICRRSDNIMKKREKQATPKTKVPNMQKKEVPRGGQNLHLAGEDTASNGIRNGSPRLNYRRGLDECREVTTRSSK